MDKTQYKLQLNLNQAKFPSTQMFIDWPAAMKKNVKQLSFAWLFSVEVLILDSLFYLTINL